MNVKRIFWIGSVLMFLFVMASCSEVKQAQRKEKKRRKELEKVKKERQEEAELAYTEAMKRHYKMQSKDTRRSMKQGKKKIERYHAGKPQEKNGFFKRLWRKLKRKPRKE